MRLEFLHYASYRITHLHGVGLTFLVNRNCCGLHSVPAFKILIHIVHLVLDGGHVSQGDCVAERNVRQVVQRVERAGRLQEVLFPTIDHRATGESEIVSSQPPRELADTQSIGISPIFVHFNLDFLLANPKTDIRHPVDSLNGPDEVFLHVVIEVRVVVVSYGHVAD